MKREWVNGPGYTSRDSMARILSISSSDVLRTTRQLVLDREGYEVRSLKDAPSSTLFADEEKFDLAIIGHTFEGHDKRRIANTINQRFPGLPILELCFHSPDIPGTDFILSDSPTDLLVAVKEILAGRRVRAFPQ